MNPSFSFIEIPSLETLQSESDSVFSMSRSDLQSTPQNSGESSPVSVEEFDYVLYNDLVDSASPIRQEDKVFFTVNKESEVEPILFKTEELTLPTLITSSETTPTAKRVRSSKRKLKEEDDDSSPFPDYYNLSKEEISFFKKIKLIQSSSRICPIQDNLYMIEVTHHDKSIEYIRCFRSSIDHLMYFCSVDVFYPILRLKENINREVKARASPENYHLIEIQNKTKRLTFLNFTGFVEIIRYRIHPDSAANTGILDLVKCNELSIELQKYL
jgi:hypothetical protein